MPSATARDFQRIARLLGFVLTRQTGSHERWTHSDGRSVTIPLHGGREIGPPLFFKILRQLNVSLEECDRLRRPRRVRPATVGHCLCGGSVVHPGSARSLWPPTP